MRYTAGLDLSDEGALLRLGGRADPREHGARGSIPVQARSVSMFSAVAEGTDVFGPPVPSNQHPHPQSFRPSPDSMPGQESLDQDSMVVGASDNPAAPFVTIPAAAPVASGGFWTVLGIEETTRAAPLMATVGIDSGMSAAAADAPMEFPLLQAARDVARQRLDTDVAGVLDTGRRSSATESATGDMVTGSTEPFAARDMAAIDVRRGAPPAARRGFGATLVSDALGPGSSPAGWPLVSPTSLSGLENGGRAALAPSGQGRWSHPIAPVLAFLGLADVGPASMGFALGFADAGLWSGGRGIGPETAMRARDGSRRLGILEALESLSMVKGTLARSLGALPQGPGREEPPAMDRDFEQDIMTFLIEAGRRGRIGAAQGHIRAADHPADNGSVGGAWTDAVSGERVVAAPWGIAQGEMGHLGMPYDRNVDTVKPSRIEAVLPGIQEGGESIEFSLPDIRSGRSAVPAIPSASGAPTLSGVIEPGTQSPAYRGVMPLVSPALSAVADQAMLSRREPGVTTGLETSRKQDVDSASRAEGSGKGIDMDALAMEMAQRIMRRIKRDKERRGLNG
ncbi:MAG: hypothetical protein GXP54_09165 [Deltaproteobacteria bacterium]|nr:hypothetical protein [Deltaproteobacteria bacterium]